MKLYTHIKTKVIAQLECDVCSRSIVDDGSNNLAALTKVYKYALEHGWQEIDGKSCCRDCISGRYTGIPLA